MHEARVLTPSDLNPGGNVSGATLALANWPATGVGGEVAPLHVHHADDEAWYVIEGALRFRLGDGELVAGAGTTVLIPCRGPAHVRERGTGAVAVPHRHADQAAAARPETARSAARRTRGRLRGVRIGVARIGEAPRPTLGGPRSLYRRAQARDGGGVVPKYLLQVNYTLDGVKGVLAKGGSARKAAAQAAAKSVGGKVDAFYFAFGGTDVFVVADLPDNAAAAALALTVTAGGGAAVTTTVLLTPEEIDHAVGANVKYRPPGS